MEASNARIIVQGARVFSWGRETGEKALRAAGSAPHTLTPLGPAGHQAADAEGVHPGVLSRPEVHVSVLHAHPYWPGGPGQQDVCEGGTRLTGLRPLHT